MFCPSDLAVRIERAEQRILTSVAARLRARGDAPFVADLGGGVACFTEPGSPLNKVAGLGFEPLDEREWEPVEQELLRRGPVQVELSTLGDPAVATMLTGRGCRLVGAENVLGRALAPASPAPVAVAMAPGIAVTVCDHSQLDRWIDVVTTGFATPDTQGVASHESFDRGVLERVMRDFALADGVVLFLATLGGEIAGAGAMRLDAGIAQLCGAATLPAQRRRGVQSSLLSFRLAHAAASGCDLAVVTTQPGSRSQQNMHRQGFDLLYCRTVLVFASAPPA